MKNKILLTSVITVVVCLSLIVGSTLALFTSDSTVNIGVGAGQVKIEAKIPSNTLTTSSMGDPNTPAGVFANTGTAKLTDGNKTLEIERMTPGDVVNFGIQVENKSNVAIKYRVVAEAVAGGGNTPDLTEVLTVTAIVNGQNYTLNKNGKTFTSNYILVGTTNGNGNAITNIDVTVSFPDGGHPNGNDLGDNAYQNGTAKLTFKVEAVQGNGV